MNLIINTLTFGLIVLIQGYACAIDWSLISTDIPKNTGSIFLNRTEIVRGFKDYNYTEVQLVEKCRGQAENQRSVIKVLDGGHIKNLIVGVNAGNGIYCEGSCTLENVHWRAVCEDAATAGKDKSTNSTVVRIIGGSAYNATDKTFQHNGLGKMIVQNFYAKDISKLTRSCGTCASRPRFFEVSNVVVDRLGGFIVGLQSNQGDRSLLLKDILVTNAKRRKDRSLRAAICETFIFIGGSAGSDSDKFGPVPNVCEWTNEDNVNIS